MATNTTVQARIDSVLKKEAERVLSEMGLKTSEGIRLFLVLSQKIF
jgi:addiction module RelB/DinJ family antitoxin